MMFLNSVAYVIDGLRGCIRVYLAIAALTEWLGLMNLLTGIATMAARHSHGDRIN